MSPAPTTSRVPRTAASLALMVGLVVLVVAFAGNPGPAGHQLTIAAPTATWMRPGLQVRVAGQVVGHVDSATPTRSGAARVRIDIVGRPWPLPAGTTASFRWPGTIAFTNRYVQLNIPKPDGKWIADDGVISGSDVNPSVELDQVTSTFGTSTRANLKSLIDEGGPTFQNAKAGLAGSVHKAPPALSAATRLLQQLGEDPAAMDTLIRSATDVVGAIDTSKPGIDTLIDGAAGTLHGLADSATSLESTLSELPATLTEVKQTLGRASGTLTSANRALVALSPGIDQVRRLARPLDTLLNTVVQAPPPPSPTSARPLRRSTRSSAGSSH